MSKFLCLMALGAISLGSVQMVNAQHACTVELNEGQGMMAISKISDNGLYVVGIEAMTAGYVWDIRKNEIDVVMPEGESSDPTAPASTDFFDVSDSGMAVGANIEAPATYKDGQWSYLEIPDKYLRGTALSVTPDGRTIVGWVSDGDKKPCMWVDGKARMLKEVKLDDTGRKAQFTQAEKISADGSVITGLVCAYSGQTGLGVIWRAPEYEPEVLFLDSLSDTKWGSYTIMDVSPDGNWLAGLALIPTKEDINELVGRPYRFDMRTRKLDIIEDVEVELLAMTSSGVYAVDNNGTVHSVSPTQVSGNPWSRMAYVSEVGKPTIGLDEYVESFGGKLNLSFSGSVAATTPSGKTIVGHGCTLDEKQSIDHYYSYIIRLDEETTGISTEKTTAQFGCYTDGNSLRITGAPSRVEILNMAGCSVYSANVNTASISLSDLSAGIYFVKMSDGKEVKVQKIIINQ